jgi:hypothetical protein
MLAIAAIAIGVFFFSGRHARALTDKDTVVLTDFVNTTGDPVFDGTLKQALAVQLGQSPYLNLLPESRIQTALQFMGANRTSASPRIWRKRFRCGKTPRQLSLARSLRWEATM